MTRLENMNPKLYKAAMKGDMKLLTSIVEVDYPPDLTLCLTPQKNTALHIAVKFEQQEIVKRMIQLCPSLIFQPNSKGDSPLHVAARAGHLDLTKLLTRALNLNLTEENPALEEGNPVRQAGSVALRMRNLEGSNPIDEALKKSHGEVALHLLPFEERHELACEVNVAGESLLYLAAEAGLNEVVQKIIDSGDYNTQGPDGQNLLHIAVIKGRFGNLIFIRMGSSPCHITESMDNREFPMTRLENMNPKLYEAAMKGDMKLLTSIVEVDCPPDLTFCLTPQKNTALHIAVKFEQQEIVERMIQLCSSLISQPNSKGDTPLHVAAKDGHLNLTKLFIHVLNLTEGNPALEEGNPVRQAGGVALRMRNLEGSNPIHEALKKSHGEVALHLLAFDERHELVREVNKAGESLLYLAAEAGLENVVQKIIDGGDYSTDGPDGQNPLHIAVIKGQLASDPPQIEKIWSHPWSPPMARAVPKQNRKSEDQPRI